MRSYRKKKENENPRKSRTRLPPFQLLILLYLLFLLGSQLTSPTSASFQDVTTIKGTLSADHDFGHQQEEKDLPLQSENENTTDVSDEGVEEDKMNEKEVLNVGEVHKKGEEQPEDHSIEEEVDHEGKEQDRVSSKEISNADADALEKQEERKEDELEAEKATKKKEQEDLELDSDNTTIESDLHKSDPSE